MNHLKEIILASVLLILTATAPVNAQTIFSLGIDGDDSLGGIVGTYPTTSTFSWLRHRFPSNSVFHSFTLGPGTDGGVVFDKTQASGELTGIRTMFNQPVSLFSVATGISINASDTIDMANLRMTLTNDVIDLGSGSGFNTLVPRVNDTGTLSAGQNGWMLGANNIYHLFYNTRGTSDGSEMLIHLTGTATVPIPPALFLFASGIALFSRCITRK